MVICLIYLHFNDFNVVIIHYELVKFMNGYVYVSAFRAFNIMHAHIGKLSCMDSVLHITETHMKTHIPCIQMHTRIHMTQCLLLFIFIL